MRVEKYSNIFDTMVKQPEVKVELSRMLRPGGKLAYMIVGLLIWSDTTFSNTGDAGQTFKISGEVPLASIPTISNIGNPGLGASINDVAGRTMKGDIKGSQIFAFQYKAVRRKAYSVMKGFTPILEDYGPRVKGDKVFSQQKAQEQSEELAKDTNLNVVIDAEEEIWTDSLGEGTLEEEEFGDIAFAFEDKESE
ncbi:hypothetical protein K440DRAFT_635454 [Wilcoxina mikolae CBS 423.85]|nr:hypothetical protein K440DRAFT_635454 [Wilcoxina mikolae CBS 423.85]